MPLSALHKELIQIYRKNDGLVEYQLNGYSIDIFQHGVLIEIQTGNFPAIKHKLECLLPHYPIHLVHPIPQEKYILVKDLDQKIIRYRKSPRKGRIEDLFKELVYITPLLLQPNFTLEILLTVEEEHRSIDGRGSWRRKGISIQDRKLLRILSKEIFMTPNDYLRLLPANLNSQFTNSNLAAALSIPSRLAGKMTYCYREMGLIRRIGKQRNAFLYQRTSNGIS